MPNPGQSDFAAVSAEVMAKLKQELDACIEGSNKDHLEMDKEDAQLMCQSIQFRSCPEETYVIVLAVARDPRKNAPTRIKCHKGRPLGGYTYDHVNEAYSTECADHFAIGLVPISFQAKLGDWTFYVPLPEPVLVKYLNTKQKENLAAYKAKFPQAEFTFSFLQLLH